MNPALLNRMAAINAARMGSGQAVTYRLPGREWDTASFRDAARAADFRARVLRNGGEVR